MTNPISDMRSSINSVARSVGNWLRYPLGDVLTAEVSIGDRSYKHIVLSDVVLVDEESSKKRPLEYVNRLTPQSVLDMCDKEGRFETCIDYADGRIRYVVFGDENKEFYVADFKMWRELGKPRSLFTRNWRGVKIVLFPGSPIGLKMTY